MSDWTPPEARAWSPPEANGWTPPEAKDADFGTALKSSFANIGNVADRAATAIGSLGARLFQGEDASDEMFKNMQEREKIRNEWANPTNASIHGIPKLLASAATLPMGIITS